MRPDQSIHAIRLPPVVQALSYFGHVNGKSRFENRETAEDRISISGPALDSRRVDLMFLAPRYRSWSLSLFELYVAAACDLLPEPRRYFGRKPSLM